MIMPRCLEHSFERVFRENEKIQILWKRNKQIFEDCSDNVSGVWSFFSLSFFSPSFVKRFSLERLC